MTAPVWHVISEPDLLLALRRCERGESADLVYAEMYANANANANADSETVE